MQNENQEKIKMKYTIFVATEPYKFQISDSLTNLCSAILEKGNSIEGIFFFGSGVYNIKKDIDSGKTIRNIPAKIEQFCKEKDIKCAGCSTWISLTGIKEKNFIENAADEGLGDLSNWVGESDKLLFFGAGI